MHIAILKGGLSSERKVSLQSGKAVADAVRNIGHKVTEIDVQSDVTQCLLEIRPDKVFNALHGTYGEDGCIQGVLEFLQIPYTHSGVMASAIAMNKPVAKQLFNVADIPCAKGKIVHRADFKKNVDPLPRPYIIKPVSDGSSVGVFLIRDGDDIPYDNLPEKILVEEYIPGRELSVAVLDGKPLGVIEICPKHGFYDYENKYIADTTKYMMPAKIPEEVYNKAMDWAKKAHDILHCRGVTRADIRYDDTDPENVRYAMLEINTHPGMTSHSLVPKIASHAGINFEQLVELLLKNAQCDNVTRSDIE